MSQMDTHSDSFGSCWSPKIVIEPFPKQMDTICKDKNLQTLQNELEKIGEGHLGACSVAYIQACKALYLCCVRKKRHPEYKTIIRNYTHHFRIMKDLGLVSETVKAHLINAHFEEIMTDTGMSLFLADTNGLEAVHAALRKSDERHGCRVTHAQVCICVYVHLPRWGPFDKMSSHSR